MDRLLAIQGLPVFHGWHVHPWAIEEIRARYPNVSALHW
jgi:hypothetical protein